VDRRVDVALAFAVAVLGAVVIVSAQTIGRSPVPDPVGPKGVPNLVGTFFIIAGLVLAGRRIVRWRAESTIVPPEGSEDDAGVPPGSARRALSIWVAALVWVITLPWLGYLVGTPLFIGFMLWQLELRRRPILGIPALVAYPIAFTASTYLFFATLLGVRIPTGFLRPLLDLIGR
jgi:putative tricarboxylic transport membrane protein